MAELEWRKPTPVATYLVSEPPGFVIARSGGASVVYTAIRSGKPWPAAKWRPAVTAGVPDGWDGSEIIHVERDLDPKNLDALADALVRCKEACHAKV